MKIFFPLYINHYKWLLNWVIFPWVDILLKCNLLNWKWTRCPQSDFYAALVSCSRNRRKWWTLLKWAEVSWSELQACVHTDVWGAASEALDPLSCLKWVKNSLDTVGLITGAENTGQHSIRVHRIKMEQFQSLSSTHSCLLSVDGLLEFCAASPPPLHFCPHSEAESL